MIKAKVVLTAWDRTLEIRDFSHCPSEVADQIGGWATDGVGQGYGSGYPLEVLMEWVKKW